MDRERRGAREQATEILFDARGIYFVGEREPGVVTADAN